MDSGPLVKANASMIREVQPASPFDFHATAPPLHPWIQPQESPLREYLRVLIKRKWTVLGCLATIFTVVAIASLKMVPIYEAAGSIAINKPDSSLVNFKDSAGGSVDYSDPTTDMDTEVAILQSDLLALQVIKTLNLDKMPEFGGKPSNGIADNLAPDPLQADSARTSSLLGAFRSGLRVSLKPNTRVVEIHYISTNPQLAASIVNTLVTTYIEQNFKTKFESTMLGTDEKQNIITEKLAELNRELTTAESVRMEKESLYRLVQSGDSDAAASMGQHPRPLPFADADRHSG